MANTENKPNLSLSRQLTKRVGLLGVIGGFGLVGILLLSLWLTILQVQQQMDEINDKAVGAFEIFFLELEGHLLTNADALSLGMVSAERLLLQLLSRSQPVMDVLLVDFNGKPQAQQNDAGRPKRTSITQPQWLSAPPAFNEVLVSPVSFEGVNPFVEMAATVSDEVGLPTGLLLVRVDLTTLWMTALDIHVGQSGYAYITDASGQIIAYRNRRFIEQGNTLIRLIGQEPGELAEREVALYTGLNGRLVLAKAQPFNGAPWFAIVEQPLVEALMPFYLPATILILVLLGGGFTLYSIFRFSQLRIAHPLVELSDAVDRMRAGKLQQEINVGYPDELGQLALSFNTMASQLHQLITNLEDQVEERTAELTAAKEIAVAAKELAETANASKSDFLARMSHEIRTPLGAVIGLTNIVLKSELTAEQLDYLSKVNIASNNLLTVINDILDFSKVEAGRLDLSQEPFDLNLLMDQLADLFSDRLPQKDLKLRFTAAPQVPRQLIGDTGRLLQVLSNLIGNAIKFTETGEIVVGVDLDDATPKVHSQTTLRFSVSDTGIGIAADVLPTLFNPFTQADGSLTRRHDGTGLGLAICKQLVKLMGGRIWAESTPGKGSTFSFTAILETRKEQPEGVGPDYLQETAPLLPPRQTGCRVLIVDDSELNLVVAEALLEDAGLIIETAANGQVAVDKVTGSGPEYYDAVLMDIQMPVMSGYEATRKIRGWEADSLITLHRVPIIALTAHALKGEKEKCLAADMDDYLAKPIDEEELHRVLFKWIPPKKKKADTSDRS